MNSEAILNLYIIDFLDMNNIPTGFNTMTSAIEFADNYNNWILRKISKYIGKSNILEIGTGQGNFKKYFKNNFSSYISIDIDQNVIDRAKERDPDGEYYCLDIASDNQFNILSIKEINTIICFNVLEHIKEDRKAIMNMSQILSSNGHILLFVPAFMGLFNDMDRLAGHFKRYTKKSIFKLIDSTNIEIVSVEYFNPIGGIGWFFNKFLKHKSLDSNSLNSQVKFFDKYVIPFSRIINPLTKRFFGQSLICVLKKK